MLVISEHANPFFLKELYLDGCENISDKALHYLTKPRDRGPYEPPNLQNYRVSELLAKESLREILSSEADLHKMITDIRQCGTRALEVISLSECR